MDDGLDALAEQLVDELLDGELALADAMQTTLLGRFYERLGDHAVHISERISYLTPERADLAMRFRLVPDRRRVLPAVRQLGHERRRLRPAAARRAGRPARSARRTSRWRRASGGATTSSATILNRLNTTFVTPFDREDIHALAEELDDVVDDMLEVPHRIQLDRRSPRPCPS